MKNTFNINDELKQKLITEFESTEKNLNGEAGNNFHKIRKDAIEKFKEIGFPLKKLEEWKYTNINPVLKHDFRLSYSESDTTIAKDDIEKLVFKNTAANVLVFINGSFSKNYSKFDVDNANVVIGNLAEMKNHHSEIFEKHFSKYAKAENNGLVALNTAFAQDGAFVYVKKGISAEVPVHLLFISDSGKANHLSQPRNLFIAEEGSSVKIIEEYHSFGDKVNYTNSVTEIFCDSNSYVEHYKIQNNEGSTYHTGTTQVKQNKNSHFTNTTISWGGEITRNNLISLFDGTNTECHFYGLYLLGGNQHVDNQTLADHAMPNCYSNELYKGIINGKATGVFNGKIMVRQDAQKTNAYQSNKNILLSDDATIYSKPQLEIFADDVKCSHGATTGQLNEEEMFYLRSRGIGEEDARTLLLKAFAGDVIDSVKIGELKDILVKKLEKKLGKNN